MPRLAPAVVFLAVLSAGCALRPRYADLVPHGTEAADARFVLVQKGTDTPLAGVAVVLGEGKQKVACTTGADGSFTLPVSAALEKDNPMLVVTLPAGVTGYDLKTLPPAAPQLAPVLEAPTPTEPAPVEAAPEEPVKPEAAPPSEEEPDAGVGSEPVSM